MRTVVIISAFVLVVAVCTVDVCCSMAKDRERTTVFKRIKGEVAAGRQQEAQDRAEGLERQIRAMRLRARKLNAEGRAAEARRLSAEIIRLSNQLDAMRKPKPQP